MARPAATNQPHLDSHMRFDDAFVWGAATAAYQIEGAVEADGRGPSVWDAFCARAGAIRGGDTGAVACDHRNRYREDVELMREIGLGAYRFSFSWTRVLPEGRGRPSEEGLGFYDRLIDALLEAGVEPYATLFHWDYPLELLRAGGWLNADSVGWFEEFAELMADRYSDRVRNWFTLNEPTCFLGLGHVDGRHAPGLQLDWPEFFLALKHASMAHGGAVQALRARAREPLQVGIVPISHIAIPADETPESVAAAREYTFGAADPERGYWVARPYLDPVLLGVWPWDIVSALTPNGPEVSDRELAKMHQPLDTLGLNFYSGPIVRAGRDGRPEAVAEPPGSPRTAFDWTVTPEGLYWSVRFHHERYGLPVVIAENGLAGLDWVSLDGKVHDPQRIDYTARYLRSLHRACGEGFPVLGYFHWSLLDNFEWAEGYSRRFGLVHVDFETQKRTPKDSARWYRSVIESRGAVLADPAPVAPYAVVR